ncbi:hypothetical protein [Kitasatospora sp. NPDC088351]|uniref:hypothetical protein n=1 Tax=Kitasatospora sp. NPDC088351 TaxID=3155180 RepID=UPI003418C8EA
MGTISRRVAAVAAAGVLLGVLTACGSGGSGSSQDTAKAAAGGASATSASAGTNGGAGAAASPSAAAGGTTAGAADGGTPAPGASAPAAGTGGAGTGGAGTGGAGTGGGAQPAAGADLDTPLLDDKLVLQLLPDQKAMTGWEEEKRRVDTADHTLTCTGAEPCGGKPLSGTARFSSGDVTVRFAVDTLPSKAAAKDKLKEAYAGFGGEQYKPIDLAALGSESRSFRGQLAGREGVGIVLRAGTVVATVTTEGEPVDPQVTQRLAVLFVQRIEQAQAGRTPDAALGAA